MLPLIGRIEAEHTDKSYSCLDSRFRNRETHRRGRPRYLLNSLEVIVSESGMRAK